MRHTPYGYDIIGGRAVVNEEKAAIIHKICESYLSGMSLTDASNSLGLKLSHAQTKRLITNKHLLGDDFYPAIITDELSRKIEDEIAKRAKTLGRTGMGPKKKPKPQSYKEFLIPRIPKKYDDPIKQAEFAYGMIRNEVSQ